MDLGKVAEYYEEKLRQFGPSPEGVDWSNGFSQRLRFKQLFKIVQKERFSINDLGCGYGEFYEFLKARCEYCPTYFGIDICERMIGWALTKSDGGRCFFATRDRFNGALDYAVASGTFNVKLDAGEEEWKSHVFQSLDHMNEMSTDGFAFNCLTSYSDSEKKQSRLFYANPCEFFDHCKRRYSRNVALLHDYGLYEFTILVRKPPNVDLRNR